MVLTRPTRPPQAVLGVRQHLVLDALACARRDHYVVIDGQSFDCPDGWVDGWYLVHPSVGGMEGLRRLRELRAAGYCIEKRPRVGSTAWQYRLER